MADAICDTCPSPGDGKWWTRDCEFVCKAGYFMAGSTCVACTHLQCLPGLTPALCSATADAVCIGCQLPSFVGVRWTSECGFVCDSGFFRRGDQCFACTREQCLPGFVPSQCNATDDSLCTSCVAPVSGEFEWISGCQFACMAGYFRDGDACIACTDSVLCAPGFLPQKCSALTDSYCATCSIDSTIGLQWINVCDFV